MLFQVMLHDSVHTAPKLIHNNCTKGHSVQELREETANYVRAHKDSLISYMIHPETGDILNDQQFEQYCHDIAKLTLGVAT